MGSTTGIELGPDTCVLAGVRTGRAGVEIVGLHIIEPAAWPAQDIALSEALRTARKSQSLPRGARVVAWGLSEDATHNEIARVAMRPLVSAGFRIDRVLTPPQALAILASTRVKPGAQNTGVAWLALNMHGVAIAIVRGSELLFARTFQWSYNPNLYETRAQLLQRYSLIAHLAPEVHRGIAAVRSSYGVHVEAAVTCGDLPELRSLTMPLIEELDLEVETLDSLEGLKPVGKAKLQPVAESAPAIRLACAAALARADRKERTAPPLARIAAAAAIVAAVAYGAYAYFSRATSAVVSSRPPQTAARPAAARTDAPRVPEQRHAAAPPVVSTHTQPVSPPPTQVAKVQPPPAPQPTRQSRTPPPAASAPNPVASASKPPPKPAPTTGAQAMRPPVLTPTPTPTPQVRPAKPEPDLPPAAAAEPPRQAQADTRGLVFPSARRPPADAPPLSDALPRVDSVLIDQERRLAVVDGTVVTVGRQVGQRVIVQIERDGVVFREPSGRLVRVPIRSR
jgi:hypothetical protein